MQFQFTRPRGARPSAAAAAGCIPRVSIHAPARGATRGRRAEVRSERVSIHAPARGATCASRRRCPRGPRSFNSRAREGRDFSHAGEQGWHPMFQFTRPRGARHGRRDARLVHHRVSIHAPARGATSSSLACSASIWFQFTRPRGARHGLGEINVSKKCFNSRAREGRDILFPSKSNNILFQFTRPRGARHEPKELSPLIQGFNSRAREGRDMHIQ